MLQDLQVSALKSVMHLIFINKTDYSQINNTTHANTDNMGKLFVMVFSYNNPQLPNIKLIFSNTAIKHTYTAI